jgi:hypothetical protein
LLAENCLRNWGNSNSSASRGIVLPHDVLHPGEPLYLREALAAHGVETDHVKVRQTVGKLRRRHGLVMSGEPREPGYRVEGLDVGGKEGTEQRQDPLGVSVDGWRSQRASPHVRYAELSRS